jgi:peptidoglycan/LPS O-acetylase OafA/YrhL
VTRLVRRVGIAIGSLVAASLPVWLVGSWIPQILGTATNPILAFVLGGLIYADIVRRDRPRPPNVPAGHAGP